MPEDTQATTTACRYCQHGIEFVEKEGIWIAPDAGTDVENGDGIWRDTCPDNHTERAAPHEPEIVLHLEIDNQYERYENETTYVTVHVPAPPDEEDPAFEDWKDDHILEVTGVGHEDGDSWYFVKVTESSDPDVIPVGTEYEFGL